jgi:hypothetical protein
VEIPEEISTMTDAEIDAWAEKVYDSLDKSE